VSRTYPALDVTWSGGADDDRLGRLIAEVDEDGPTAVEEHQDHARIFFASPAARTRAAVRLIALEPDLLFDPVDVPDESWAERSQASLGPVRVGRIVVAPPWAQREGERLLQDDPGSPAPGILITIQPSMGFGTAHHASTRLCLHLMQDLSLIGAKAIDLGTGSGVLAIAAVRLGAARVIAIDHDPDALTSARENIDLNHVGDLVALRQSDLERSSERGGALFDVFDLALANLTGAVVVRAAATLGALIGPSAHVIVSGVTSAEETDVLVAMSACALQLRRREEEDGWVGHVWGKTPAVSPAPDRP
jgi:ribosomal protein L11 methyltransferase